MTIGQQSWSLLSSEFAAHAGLIPVVADILIRNAVMGVWRWTIGRKLMALSSAGLIVAAAIAVTSATGVGTIHVADTQRNALAFAEQRVRHLESLMNSIGSTERDSLLAYDDRSWRAAESRYSKDAETVRTIWAELS